jgi:Ca2+-binding RTX toxin-like protein
MVAPDFTVLHVVADGGNNSVVIRDSGTSSGGVTVLCNGVPTTPAVAVDVIDVRALGGNNTVLYQVLGGFLQSSIVGRVLDVGLGGSNNLFDALIGGALLQPLTINAQGGDGNDTMTIDLLPTILAIDGGRLQLNLVGGAGSDVLRVNAPNVVLSPRDSTHLIASELDVNLIGGSGSDVILADIGARLLLGSNLNVLAQGGLGNNLVNADLRLNRDAPLVGEDILDAELSAHVEGGGGNDNLGLFVRPGSIRRNSIDASILGGQGFDVFRHTSNVRVFGRQR